MKIGLDGNEANIENRVGSGKYAYELIKQFSQNKKAVHFIGCNPGAKKKYPKIN